MARLLELTCAGCGKRFLRSTNSKRRKRRFCTRECGNRMSDGHRQHYGRRPDGATRIHHGYVYEKVPGRGWVRQHRLVMERQLGRRLGAGETVHHIDGDRVNNALENLQLRRHGHGAGQTFCCLDCGSGNVKAMAL